MYCQCESNTHEHQGKKDIECNNQATETVVTHYGKYYLCKRCADSYDNAGYVYSRASGIHETMPQTTQQKIAKTIHEEEEAIASYRQEAKTLPPKAAKRFREIARDEVQHKQELKKLRQIY